MERAELPQRFLYELAVRYRPTLIIAGLTPLPKQEESPATAKLTDARELRSAIAAQLMATGNPVRPTDVEQQYQRLSKNREILKNLERLRSAGSRVEYYAVDVRDEQAFGTLIDEIYRRHKRLDCVVHGAGLIEDKFVRDKTPDSFDRVVHCKTDSAFILARKLRRDTLKSLVFMSSVTAAFGNAAQSDYAAANGVLNGMASWLSHNGPRTW